jgi:hypothetical protein
VVNEIRATAEQTTLPSVPDLYLFWRRGREMKVLKIYSLDINEFGELTKRLLADVFEDGRVEGDTFIANFLRSTVNKFIGPVHLEVLQKTYTNGYYAAEIVSDNGE